MVHIQANTLVCVKSHKGIITCKSDLGRSPCQNAKFCGIINFVKGIL